ncbi:hypothetical protein MKX01_033252 [Papaver californicum]|nr:hypothetical protein MKX01_033252 [Papaver californicum]
MFKELPDCYYETTPSLVCPENPTPKHSLYLSNLDDQKSNRFSTKYLYVYKKSIPVNDLKSSLSKVLSYYYPLAGRLRISEENEDKLEVDCNGEGALFAEAFMSITVDEFMQLSKRPNISWKKKLLCRVDAQSFLGIPPLVIQVTNLSCGGLILCIAINHCLCDAIGTSQFLHAWAHLQTKPNVDLSVLPFHSRHVLEPRDPQQITFSHPEFTNTTPTPDLELSLLTLNSQPLVPSCLTFTPSRILRLKRLCAPSLTCTSFEALATHVWRCWIKALNPHSSLKIKLLFSANIRESVELKLPKGYYGNGFVLGCAETTVTKLVSSNMHHGVKLVQNAKAALTADYVKSMVDFLEENRVIPDVSSTFVISSWLKLGLEALDFGEGKPLHMGQLASEIYCLFLPVVGDLHAVKVLVSVPEKIVGQFEHYMINDLYEEDGVELIKDGLGLAEKEQL